MERITLDTNINLRVTAQVRDEFIAKATRSGRRWTDVLRQLMESYIAGAPGSPVIPQQNEGVS